MILRAPTAMLRTLLGAAGAALRVLSTSLNVGLKVGAACVLLRPARAQSPRALWVLVELCCASRLLLAHAPQLSAKAQQRKPGNGAESGRGVLRLIVGLSDFFPVPVLSLGAISWIASITNRQRTPRLDDSTQTGASEKQPLSGPLTESQNAKDASNQRRTAHGFRVTTTRRYTCIPSDKLSTVPLPQGPPFPSTATPPWAPLLDAADVDHVQRVRHELALLLKSKGAASPPPPSAAKAILPPPFTDDEVMRFLLVSKGDPIKCARRLQQTWEWRQTFRPMSPNQVLSEFGHIVFWHPTQPTAIAGTGRPCLVVRFGALASQLPAQQRDRFVHGLVSLIDFGLKTLVGPPDGRIVVLVDCRGCTSAVWTLPLGMLQGLARTLHSHFPDRLAAMKALHTPLPLRVLAGLVLQVVNESTRKKAQLVGSQDPALTSALQDVFGHSKSAIPGILGGSCACRHCSRDVGHTGAEMPDPARLVRSSTKRRRRFVTREVAVPGYGVQRIRMQVSFRNPKADASAFDRKMGPYTPGKFLAPHIDEPIDVGGFAGKQPEEDRKLRPSNSMAHSLGMCLAVGLIPALALILLVVAVIYALGCSSSTFNADTFFACGHEKLTFLSRLEI